MRTSKPFLIFYVVFAYVLAFAIWWSVLLLRTTQEEYNYCKRMIELSEGAQLQAGEIPSVSELEADMERKKLMIFSEGGAFVLLLLFGFWRVRKAFLKEMELANRQRNFTLSITHELKSPLAGIKLVLETLLKRPLDKEKQAHFISNSLHDVDRLENLVNNILYTARIENPGYGIQLSELNLTQIVAQVVEKQRALNPDREIRFNVQKDMNFKADEQGFRSVVNNLVENALKYSEKEVYVEIAQQGIELILRVADQGVGVPPEEKEKIFEKFYRMGNEETRSNKGTGLGLFIVKRITELHNWKVGLKENTGGGTIFELTMPISA